MVVAALASQIYGFIHDGTTVPVALLMTALAGCALVAYFPIVRRHRVMAASG